MSNKAKSKIFAWAIILCLAQAAALAFIGKNWLAKKGLVPAALGTAPAASDVVSSLEYSDVRLDEKAGVLFTEKNGTKIVYTIDPKLQTLAEKLFQEFNPVAGAFVAIDARTGDVVVMASHARNRKNGDSLPEGSTFLDPALRNSANPMASIAKIVTASAAMRHGLFGPTDTLTCAGSFRAGGGVITDPVGVSHGKITMADALAKSCNPSFAQIGLKVGRDRLLEEFRLFGFNRSIEFDLPALESRAAFGDDEYSVARAGSGFHGAWMSPLHAAMIASTISNRGVMMRPRVIRSIDAGGGERSSKPVALLNPMSEKNAVAIEKMMDNTVNRPGFTAYRGFHHNGRYIGGDTHVVGKTGSLSGNNPAEMYTWLIGHTTEGSPDIAFAAMVVNDERWVIKAASFSGQFFKHAGRGK